MGNNLTGEYISNTYQRVTQIISGTFFDGTGSQITGVGFGMTNPGYAVDAYNAGSYAFRARSSNHSLIVGDGVFFTGYHYHFAQASSEQFRISMEGGASTTNLGIGLNGLNVVPLGYSANYGYNGSRFIAGSGPYFKVYSNDLPTGTAANQWIGMAVSASTSYIQTGTGTLVVSSSSVTISGSLVSTGDINGGNFTHAILGEANIDKIAITSAPADYKIRGFQYGGTLTLAAAYLHTGGKIILYGGTHATNANNIYLTRKVGINTTAPLATLDVSGSGRFLNELIVTGSIIAVGGITGSLNGTASWAANSITKIARHDFTGSYSYCGTAIQGSLESNPAWTIARIQISNAGTTSTQYAYTSSWTDRYSLTYI